MNHNDALIELIRQAEEAAQVRKATVDHLGLKMLELSGIMSGVIGSSGKILLAGNGGSAAMSSHFAAEMVVRLSGDRNREALPAIALSTDMAILTAVGNDYGFEHIFARQVEALGHRGDMLIVLSTSGNSENLVRAVSTARQKQIITAGLLGGDGGQLGKQVDKPLIVPHRSTQRIQEEHLFMIHQLVEMVERDLFA
ncbi:MAG: SIS domain-containing protein [Candidatus Zixiibacteriota bacterium]